MGIFDKIFGKMEEGAYIYVLRQVINPLMEKIDAIEEKEVREFFKVILDASERSLRGILFMAPSELDFKTPSRERDKNFWGRTMKEKSAFYKKLTKEEIDFWLRKVSLALVAYSYYFFSIKEQPPLVKFSYKAYWQRMFDSYNKIFDENITIKEINHYTTGLKEGPDNIENIDIEKELESMKRDYQVIAIELLRKIWNADINTKVLEDLKKYKPGYGMENLDPLVKKIIFLGDRIWQAHRQIVQPFLAKLLNM
jgi:hypothetical protein